MIQLTNVTDANLLLSIPKISMNVFYFNISIFLNG